MTATPTSTGMMSSPHAATGSHRGGGQPSGVPWSTVLPLAMALALTAGFWTVALRTSLGSIERTTSPFASWARESTLLLPFYVLAVLAALTLARRRFGRNVDGVGEVGAVLPLVAGFGTLVGIAQLAISSAYDYHLQMAQTATMSSMRDDCPVDCQSAVQQATLDLQERSVLIGGLLLLVTNVVIVVWVVALRGWRLRLTRTRPSGSEGVLDRIGPTRGLLAAGLAGGAAIHAAVVPEHLAEWTAAGVFFLLLALAEVVLAALVVVRRSHALHLACLMASIGPLMLWLGSRTLGIPFGPAPGVPEPIGLADTAACVLELVTLVAALILLRSRTSTELNPGALQYALALVVAVSALGLGGTELNWVSLGAQGQSVHNGSGSPDGGAPPTGPLNHP